MREQIRALIWEYLRESGWLVIASVGIIAIAPLAFGQALGLLGAGTLNTPDEPLKLYVNYLGIAALGFLLPHAYAMTATANRHRGLPVPTRVLAGLPLLLAIALVMVSNVVVLCIYRWSAGIDWPVLTTTVVVGAFTALSTACIWWIRDFRSYKPWLISGGVILWVWWILRHVFPEDMTGPAERWESLTLPDIAGLSLSFVFSWYVTIRSYSVFRCGAENSAWLFATRLPFRSESPVHRKRNSATERLVCESPRDALAVMHMNTSRPWVIGCGVLAACGFCDVRYLVMRDRANPARGMSAMLSVFSVIAGIIAGSDVWMKKSSGMRPFLATLPISDREFAEVMLKNKLRLASLVWLILAATTAIVLLYAVQAASLDLARLADSIPLTENAQAWSPIWLLLQSALLCWIGAGIMGAISVSGRVGLIVALLFAIEIAMAAMMFLNGLESDGVAWARGWAGVLAVVTSLMFGPIVTMFLFIVASRARLLPRATVLFSAGGVLLLSLLLWNSLAVSGQWKLVWCFAAFAVVMPLAAIPCAVLWNRHR